MRSATCIGWLLAFLGSAGLSVESAAQVSATAPGAFDEVRFETADGGQIFGNLYGEGSHAVVLAHGAIFDKESWDTLATRLAAEGYSALAIDFRGYGKSKAGRRPGALYEDILGGIRFLKERGATRVSVIGASMGGGAAGNAAARVEPGEIDHLILLAAVAAESPERMQGKKLFIVSRDDGIRRTVERQFNAAAEPKELRILEGSAHAQHIFRTGRGRALTEAILASLAENP
jgi:dienelactone hydrolase